MKTTIKIFAASAASFGLGYVFAKRSLEQSYLDLADSEIADMKKHYEDKLAADMLEYEEYLARGEIKANLQAQVPEQDRRVFESTPEVPQVVEQREYDGPAAAALESYQIGEAAAYLEKREIVPSGSNRIPAPYVITEEQYMQNEFSWTQDTLTYYAGDNVLANQEDEELAGDERAAAIGSCINNFGEGSSVPNIVYVRSPAYQAEYEVVKVDGKFSVEALGLGEEAQ